MGENLDANSMFQLDLDTMETKFKVDTIYDTHTFYFILCCRYLYEKEAERLDENGKGWHFMIIFPRRTRDSLQDEVVTLVDAN